MGIFRRFFGRKRNATTSMEDRIAEASIQERQAFNDARRAEDTLEKAVSNYKEAKKQSASKVQLIGLRDKVERANDAYDARIQIMRNSSTNVSLINQVENNKLLKAAAKIKVAEEEIADSTKEAALRIEEQRQAKLSADQHKERLKESYEIKSQDVNALLGEDDDLLEDPDTHQDATDRSNELGLE